MKTLHWPDYLKLAARAERDAAFTAAQGRKAVGRAAEHWHACSAIHADTAAAYRRQAARKLRSAAQ